MSDLRGNIEKIADDLYDIIDCMDESVLKLMKDEQTKLNANIERLLELANQLGE